MERYKDEKEEKKRIIDGLKSLRDSSLSRPRVQTEMVVNYNCKEDNATIIGSKLFSLSAHATKDEHPSELQQANPVVLALLKFYSKKASIRLQRDTRIVPYPFIPAC